MVGIRGRFLFGAFRPSFQGANWLLVSGECIRDLKVVNDLKSWRVASNRK